MEYLDLAFSEIYISYFVEQDEIVQLSNGYNCNCNCNCGPTNCKCDCNCNN